jgi:glutamyl-tRNA synthetase
MAIEVRLELGAQLGPEVHPWHGTCVDGRFAPSPSGPLHLGSLRTALVAWLFARSAGSRFLVRIEDLDAASSREEHVEGQLRDLGGIGLDWDGDVVRQSSRRQLHDRAIDRLTEAGLTYPCWCTRREVLEAATAPHGAPGSYPGTCRDTPPRDDRPAALRLRGDGAREAFVDRVAGAYEGVVDDFVVRRNDGTPAYNLAVVVDDDEQGIEEVVRGDDLLPSTPRQVRLARVLGLRVPSYAHVPMVVGGDGQRLAKRHGAITLAETGLSGDEVRAVLAESLGLPPTLDGMLDAFDPNALPRAPWTIPQEMRATM